jgi:hypothetical protein
MCGVLITYGKSALKKFPKITYCTSVVDRLILQFCSICTSVVDRLIFRFATFVPVWLID